MAQPFVYLYHSLADLGLDSLVRFRVEVFFVYQTSLFTKNNQVDWHSYQTLIAKNKSNIHVSDICRTA